MSQVPFSPALSPVGPSKTLLPQQLLRHTITAGLRLLLQKHELSLPWPGQCSGCDGDGAGSQSFRDRDGNTEKHKQRIRGREARTRTNSTQGSSGGPYPAHSWAASAIEGGLGLFQFAWLNLELLVEGLGAGEAPRFMASWWSRGCRGQVGSPLDKPFREPQKNSSGWMLG